MCVTSSVQNKNPHKAGSYFGGREGNRTLTHLREPDFESSASTSSATRPRDNYITFLEKKRKKYC